MTGMNKINLTPILIAIAIAIILSMAIYSLSNRINSLEEENDMLYSELMAERLKVLDIQRNDFIISDDIDQYIYEAMGYFDIRFPDLVYAQSILETGYYSSDVCIQKNNLFGLYDSAKQTYHSYNYWWESLKAYKTLIQNKFKGETLEDYFVFLDTLPYATDSLYITKLKDVYYEIIPE